MRWSLDELYTSFDSKEFQEDIERYEMLIQEFSNWSENKLGNSEDSLQTIEEYISYLQQLSTLVRS